MPRSHHEGRLLSQIVGYEVEFITILTILIVAVLWTAGAAR